VRALRDSDVHLLPETLWPAAVVAAAAKQWQQSSSHRPAAIMIPHVSSLLKNSP